MNLPTNYLIRAGTVLADTQLGLSGIAGHQVHAGDATWSVSEETSSTYCRPSGVTKVFKAEVTAPGTIASYYRFDFVINRTLLGVSSFQFPVYFSGSTTSAEALWYVAKETAFTNFYTYQNNSVKLTPNRWNFITQSRHQPDGTNGTPAISDTFVRVRIRLQIPIGEVGTFYVCPIYINYYTKPTVVFTFDDGDTSLYTKAFAYMNATGRKVPGSLALNQPGVGGSSDPVTPAQLQEMLAAGWSVHNHGASHAHMTTLNAAQLEQEIAGPITYWAGEGITLDPDTFVLPFGERDANVDAALRSRYRYSMLATGSNFSVYDGMPDNLLVERRAMDEPSTLSALKSNLDAAEKWGGAIIFYGHVVADAASSGETTTATLQGLVDEVVRRRDANRIQVRNLADFFAGLSNPRRKRL